MIESPTILEKYKSSRPVRVVFDAANTKHRKLYAEFSKSNRWPASCPFELEWPALTVPQLCEQRLVAYYIAADKKLHK